MSFEVFVDGVLRGTSEDLSHSHGSSLQYDVSLSDAKGDRSNSESGEHTLTIIAEELGYANYGFKQGLLKGIVDDVKVSDAAGNTWTIDAQWTLRGGLAGEHLGLPSGAEVENVSWTPPQGTPPAVWYHSTFTTPSDVAESTDSKLLLNATGLNRGRIWVNGHDVGRYYLKQRNEGSSCGGPSPAPAPAPTTCKNPSQYNNSSPYNGTRCYGLEAVHEGDDSADSCFAACCARNLNTWQYSTEHSGGGCWCGTCNSEAPVTDPKWVGGQKNDPTPLSTCATQTLYYIPSRQVMHAQEFLLWRCCA